MVSGRIANNEKVEENKVSKEDMNKQLVYLTNKNLHDIKGATLDIDSVSLLV